MLCDDLNITLLRVSKMSEYIYKCACLCIVQVPSGSEGAKL